ncbi:dethiobiotin synthase [Variovorax sp. J31P207]|uniref:dethiobiotin synthase n=1 Tax=Variovorax sp. J31P207 TaxID=3053510 RepID=UPI002574A699|nr:dethiobiotin synthase [Variovorax sp. J31P207]MDM0070002.1 dethiobiotin synthase [Variovorax sp. J31P207]
MTAVALRGCFVTGTDTEVGKTRISAALLHWLGMRGQRCAGYKPVAAGTQLIEGKQANEDVGALRDASSVALTDAAVGPFQFKAACAPHIAAALEGRGIERAALLQGANALAARAECLIVEGVGGFCVPLGLHFDSADVAMDLGLSVVLVVGLRLGCINHALLSAEAIRSRGLRLAGWVANTVDPAMLHRDDNLATLRHELGRRHQAPCLGVVSRLTSPHPAAVAAQLDDAALQLLFGLS